MPEYVEVKTQAQLNRALAREDVIPICIGGGYFSVTDSATVEAWDSATVRAWDSATVRASKYVAIRKCGDGPKVTGGVIIEVPTSFATPQDWCDYYGVEVKRGIATLFKGTDEDFATRWSRPAGIYYKPGSKPKAPDWDGGVKECGGGLHGWPRAHFAEGYAHIVACPVKLAEIVVHKNASMPEKVKFSRICSPVYEVDLSGKRI